MLYVQWTVSSSTGSTATSVSLYKDAFIVVQCKMTFSVIFCFENKIQMFSMVTNMAWKNSQTKCSVLIIWFLSMGSSSTSGVLFTGKRTIQWEIGQGIGATGEVLRMLYCTVVTEWEPSQAAKVLLYRIWKDEIGDASIWNWCLRRVAGFSLK